MRESHFIQQNREKWEEFEQVLESTQKDPDKLHDVFIQITDDLSHARTFYPSRSVRAYLNGVAQNIFTDIYKQKKSPLSKIRYFFTDELPQVVYESRSSFLWATLFFILSFVIGYFSSMQEPEFLRTILGDSYVDMTIENIKKGDPMAVYKNSGRFDMTFGIMANNIRVTLMYFILGIFAGIGSVALMMYNGVMLGAFLQFFSQNNLLREANLTVWMHGVLEISAIVIGTAAGITMGKGLLFPGTYSRLQAFQMSSRKAIKIMIGVTVMLVIAALIEGNLTRHTEIGDLPRGAFIATCLGAVLFYYGWYPFYKARKGFKQPLQDAQLPPDRFAPIEYFKIKNSGEIFGDTFLFFKRHMNFYLRASALAALGFCLYAFLFSNIEPDAVFKLESSPFEQWTVIGQFFMNTKIPFLPYLNSLIYATLTILIFKNLFLKEPAIDIGKREKKRHKQQVFIDFIKITAVFSIMMLLINAGELGAIAYFFILLPFSAIWMFLMYRDRLQIVDSLRHAWWLMSSGFSLTFSTHYIMLLIGYLFFAFFNSAIVYLYMWVVGWNLSFITTATLDQTTVIIMSFIASFCLFLNFMLFYTAMVFLYYSLLEINEANNLLERIKQIGMGKKIQGLARD